MFESSGGLKDHWHVIALSSEIAKHREIRKDIYDRSILLWRDAGSVVHAIVNCCAHKRAPLAVSDFKTNEVTCPYHGWRYDSEGRLTEIPSSPHLDVRKLGCSIDVFPVTEQDGFVWIFLKTDRPSFAPPRAGDSHMDAWKHTFLHAPFETTEELLIDNFMDAVHTTTIHQGIIRGHQTERVAHSITVTTDSNGVLAEFDEQHEDIAIGLRWFLGKELKIRHTDEFLLPNLVRVNYHINGIHRFQAFIACTPESMGKTMSYVRLSYDFGFLNPLIQVALPVMAAKVLRQDVDVTRDQYANQVRFPDVKEKLIDSDVIHNKVKRVRDAATHGRDIVRSEKRIQINL